MSVRAIMHEVHFKNIEDGVELIDEGEVPLYFDNWCKENGIGYQYRFQNGRAQMLFDDSDGHTCFVLRWRNAWGKE